MQVNCRIRGRSPLYFAVKNNRAEMVELLLAHGANTRRGYIYGQCWIHLWSVLDTSMVSAGYIYGQCWIHLWSVLVLEVKPESRLAQVLNTRQIVS